MTDADRELQVFESEDGILLWGVPEALALVDEDPALTTRTIGPSNLVARLGNVLGGTSALMTESGRWLRLDDASVAYVRRHGVTNLSRGVLRTRDLAGGEGTRIAKHLRFSSVSLANPAGTAVLSSMATQMAIQHSLEQMQRCLEQIDVKVGRLIEADRTRVMSELDGFAGAVREAESLRVATGTVSATTWSKVENNSTPLRAHQSRAIRELRSLADEIEGCGKDVDGLADALTRAERETTFWMKVLARTILIQDEQYCVELERVASDTPDELEDHRRVIVTVRSERTASIIEALEGISGSIARSAELSNAGCVMNPINSGRVTRHANRVNEIIDAFASRAGVELSGSRQLDGKKWFRAVGGMAGDAAGGASRLVHGVGARAGRLHTALDDAVVARANRILDERRSEAELERLPPVREDAAGDGEDPRSGGTRSI